MKKYLIALALVAVLGIGAAFLTDKASADTGYFDLSGWAWSNNIGWINMSSTTQDGHSYSVKVGLSGDFKGYAWSNHVGWISFNSGDVSGCPIGSCPAKINTATGEVSGWAKVLSMGSDDGWIQLAGDNHPSGTYCSESQMNSVPPTCTSGVTYSSSAKGLGGFAYEPTDLGWIAFYAKCPNCNFLLNALSVSCTGTYVAPNVRFDAYVQGGTPSYNITWLGDVSGTGNSVTVSGTPGTTVTANVRATDSAATPAVATNSCYVNVPAAESGSVDLKIHPLSPSAAGSNFARIRTTQSAYLTWGGVTDLATAGYACTAAYTGTATNGPSDTWVTNFNGSPADSEEAFQLSDLPRGTYTYTVTCSKSGEVDKTDSVNLQVTSSSIDET